jgi:hypothetical protein
MKLRWLVLATLLACGGDGKGDDPPDDDPMGDDPALPEAPEEVEWTVLVYGHGDHNLSYSLARDILEMAEAELGDDVTVLVMADWDGSTQGFSTGTEWYRIDGGGAEPRLVAEWPELDLDDPEVLALSVATAFEANPARRYGLILWDHGGAWKHGFGSDLQDGTVASPSPMSVPEIRAGILAGMEAAGLAGKPLELLAFDTCLMAGAEIASAMVGVSRLLVANAEIDYGNGWDYEVAFSALAEGGTTADFAKVEVAAWNTHHQPPESPGVPDALFRTHVAIDLEKWGAFETRMQALVSLWIGSSTGQLVVPKSAADALPGFELSSVGQLGAPPELRDLGQFLGLLAATSADPQVAVSAQLANEALEATILARAQGAMRTAQSGVHFQLPPASQIGTDDVAAYRVLASEWATRSRWAEALERVVALRDTVAPDFTTTLTNGTNPTAQAPPTLQVQSADADVAQVGVYLGYVEPANTDVLYLIGLVGGGKVQPGVVQELVWRGGALTLPGPNGRQFVSVDLWARSPNTTLLRAGGFLSVMGGNYEAALLIDVQSGQVDGLLVHEPSGNSSVFELSEVEGAVFTPLIPTLRISTGAVGAVEGSPITLGATPPSVQRTSVPTGTAILFTQMEDIWGNQSLVLDGVSIGTPIPQ